MLENMTEDQLLNEETRKALIEKSFDSDANKKRKGKAFKAYECLNDKTNIYVVNLLLKQFSSETVQEMQYAVANISVLRKVIHKLAKVYANGCKRTGANETETKSVEQITEQMSFNETMKKVNRYFRTFKNTLLYVRPQEDDEGKNEIVAEAIAPFLYDVIPNPKNPKEPLGVILSDYVPTREVFYTEGDPATVNRGKNGGRVRVMSPSEVDKEDSRRFVWWTKKYHFTTNAKGKIIAASEGAINPILELPFVNFAADRDTKFWAEGGDDLVDGGISINVGVTNAKHVAVSQGYGQLYMTGKNLPKGVKVGPNHCVQLSHDKDDPNPTIGYLNANPPLSELKALIEMELALLLTTNNLSTSGFSTSLASGKDFASGIALILDKAESIEDISEQSQIFVKKEPEAWGLICKWLDVYKGASALVEEQAKIKTPKKPEEIKVAFPPAKPILSEKEHLEILKMRQELGLNKRAELLMRDDPSLTEEEANEKIVEIDAEKQARAEAFGMGAEDGDKSQEGNGKPGEDDGDDRNIRPSGNEEDEAKDN